MQQRRSLLMSLRVFTSRFVYVQKLLYQAPAVRIVRIIFSKDWGEAIVASILVQDKQANLLRLERIDGRQGEQFRRFVKIEGLTSQQIRFLDERAIGHNLTEEKEVSRHVCEPPATRLTTQRW